MLGLFPTYGRFDLTVESAEGVIIKDIAGKSYIDFGAGIGVNNLGHRHPAVESAVEEQLKKYWHLSNLYPIPLQEEVAEKITANSPASAVFFANSGAEANEAAIKLARKATGKDKIITFGKSFHGRTFATMAATGQEKVRTGFGAMLPGFAYATYNDLESVKALADKDTAAVMIEMVQGEGGVNPGNTAFIQSLSTFCEEKDILLIIDEIQTGMGRTGKKFAFEHYDIEPDIFTLAKGLGNGVPVGAMAAKEKLVEHFGPGTHGSTFGGNPLAMAAASAVCDVIFNDTFLEQIDTSAKYLSEALSAHIAPLESVIDIRQKGLMVGIEINANALSIVKELLKNGLVVLAAGENVVRLLPPLTISKTDIDQAVALMKDVLK